MNLNELFFFKVFPCYKNNSNELNLNIHNENNCYFYHTFSKFNQDGTEKIEEKVRRREPISFSKLFKELLNKLKYNQDYLLSPDTIFELKNGQTNINYYTDSMPFIYLNKFLYFNSDCCLNETEFNYHMNRYKKNLCRFFKINKICKNKFCYSRHINEEDILNESNKENFTMNIINNLVNNEVNIDIGIYEFRKILKIWEEKKEIKFKEIIDLYNYILSFENKYLSDIQLNEIKENYSIFQKWYNDYNKNKSNNLNKVNYIDYKILKKYEEEDEISPNEKIINNIYKSIRLVNGSSQINKNSNLLETLKINTNVCYISKYTNIKKAEIIKYVYAMLNSSDGVIIYGGHENNNSIKGISLNRKERDKFKIWFNSEFIKILIKYEDNLKYNFYDLANNSNDECVLVIEIKKIKSYKFLIKFPAKCLIIKEKFLNRNKHEKNKLLNEENIKELDLREYLEVLRKKLLDHYLEKFKVKI